MFPVMSAGNPITGYNINNSLRFRASASAYLSRTPSSTGNRQKFTYSFWIKRGTLGTLQRFIGISDNLTGDFIIDWTTSNTLEVYDTAGTTLVTTQVFRDPSAWYHIVIAFDTTQATAANRVKMYVNGSQVTAFGTATYPTQNSNSFNNQASIPARIGIWPSGSQYFDGYMAEFNFIDGQQLDVSSFGSTDAVTGQWLPKAYSGTYGTNGFYLQFSSIATTSGSNTGLGKDFSGNGNYWNTNNISVTAGATYDAMTDSPTLTSTTVGNYATWNAALKYAAGYTLSGGNLNTAYSSGTGAGLKTYSSIGVTSGKWYFEYTFTASNPNFFLGWRTDDDAIYFDVGCSSGNILTETSSGSFSGSTVTVTSGDVIGVALDYSNSTCYFYKNNTLFYTVSGITISGATLFASTGIWSGGGGASSGATNFGQRPFAYTPPTGYLALNTYNLPTPTIKAGNKYMDATTYTGTGVSNTVVNQGQFKPDLVWMKARNAAQWNLLFDSVRGVGKWLTSNNTTAEVTDATSLTAFNSNGFAVSTDPAVSADTGWNASGNTMVGWQWQAGQGTTSSNTSGSITSTVSVNTTAGFSVVTYTGTGANATVGHGLGVAPKMIIFKNRSSSLNWIVYTSTTGAGNVLFLDATNASTANTTAFNNTAPTSTVFSVGAYNNTNQSTNNMVAYCWAEIAGFSAFSSYTGNGSTDGTFVYTGFRPKFVMIKRYDAGAESWTILDTSVNTYNLTYLQLFPNSSNAEVNGSGRSPSVQFDYLSNGFKLRGANGEVNGSGWSYIYAAFAENPFKHANAR